MVRTALRAALPLALASVACACNPTSLPGSALGTYHVTAKAQANTCGLTAPDPWTFDVQLSQDGTTLYWSFMDGSAPLSGTLDTQSKTTITDSTQANVDGTDASLGPCTMDRADALQVDLSTGSPPPSFAGTIGYTFSVPAGANCADQLASSGGQYTTLPCTVTYSVAATRN